LLPERDQDAASTKTKWPARFRKDKEPVTRVSMKSISGQQERKDDSGAITLKFLGKYEAAFSVTAPD
jgi:hypothetical protein